METTILAIAAVLLLAVQTHRNFLMIKNASNQSQGSFTAPVPVTVTVELPEEYWPTVTVSNDVVTDIDYYKLGDAIKKALIESGVVLHNAKLPIVEPIPYWQSPIINEVTHEDGHTSTTNAVEVNGVPGKQFPAR